MITPISLYSIKYKTYICPICGVASNLYPDYVNSIGTDAIQRFSYCGHKLLQRRKGYLMCAYSEKET